MIKTLETTLRPGTDKTKPHETSKVYFYANLDGIVYHYPDMLEDESNQDLKLVAIVSVIHEPITENCNENLYKKIVKVANKIYEENVFLINDFKPIWEM